MKEMTPFGEQENDKYISDKTMLYVRVKSAFIFYNFVAAFEGRRILKRTLCRVK